MAVGVADEEDENCGFDSDIVDEGERGSSHELPELSACRPCHGNKSALPPFSSPDLHTTHDLAVANRPNFVFMALPNENAIED